MPLINHLYRSFEDLRKNGCKFVFSDRHAKLEYAKFFNSPEDVSQLNWEYIKSEDWGRKHGAERKEMKQAECLVYKYVPIEAISGIAVFNEESQQIANNYLLESGINIPVKIKPNFYF